MRLLGTKVRPLSNPICPISSTLVPSSAVYQGLQELGVRVIFGERLDMSSLNGDGTNPFVNQEKMLVKTVKGREIEADLVVRVSRQVFVKLFVDWLIRLLYFFSSLYNESNAQRTASLYGSET